MRASGSAYQPGKIGLPDRGAWAAAWLLNSNVRQQVKLSCTHLDGFLSLMIFFMTFLNYFLPGSPNDGNQRARGADWNSCESLFRALWSIPLLGFDLSSEHYPKLVPLLPML